MLKLDDIAQVLGCSKAAASMVRAGKYDRPGSDLPARYAALARLLAAPRAASRAEALRAVCLECQREDCAGCRLMEITV